MRQLVSWAGSACVGFARACVVVVVAMLVPAVWAAAVAVWIWWWDGDPWSGIAPLVWAAIGTLALSRPLCRMVRSLVERWTGTVIPAGYREAGPVIQLSTGYWWNGFSYERTSRDALLDQKWRTRWRDPAVWRDLRFTAIAPVTMGVVAAIPLGGVVAAALGFSQPDLSARLVGVLGLVVAIAGAPYAWRSVEPVAVRFLRASTAMALADRVNELTAQRADTTVAQAAEIRRIERNLHDGAQARLVALGLSLATVEKLMETHPDQARALLRDARAGAATSLTELRDLVRGINPPVLTERGLIDAVRALALNSPLEAAVSTDVQLRLDPPIESAVYFGVAELMTNAVKHAHATRARISITRDDTDIVVDVEDDGRGGAGVRDGGGLAGLRRRLAVFDGTLEITSPAGGPTRVRMVVPCASL
ncbi:sensor domain-containing protein [Planotetraspora phitsanulokensis]|uniref:histidine kinase n=1 Tax=Planotetraspora phitsanulokensis TaxID=575192 RepID=A0A8J3UJ86_9ACTN|nr:histidine kinase [Planotetraspora phitsanulokensis]GII39810.1 histidine kinase [Planotetraspora phitsanulokensis]